MNWIKKSRKNQFAAIKKSLGFGSTHNPRTDVKSELKLKVMGVSHQHGENPDYSKVLPDSQESAIESNSDGDSHVDLPRQSETPAADIVDAFATSIFKQYNLEPVDKLKAVDSAQEVYQPNLTASLKSDDNQSSNLGNLPESYAIKTTFDNHSSSGNDGTRTERGAAKSSYSSAKQIVKRTKYSPESITSFQTTRLKTDSVLNMVYDEESDEEQGFKQFFKSEDSIFTEAGNQSWASKVEKIFSVGKRVSFKNVKHSKLHESNSHGNKQDTELVPDSKQSEIMIENDGITLAKGNKRLPEIKLNFSPPVNRISLRLSPSPEKEQVMAHTMLEPDSAAGHENEIAIVSITDPDSAAGQDNEIDAKNIDSQKSLHPLNEPSPTKSISSKQNTRSLEPTSNFEDLADPGQNVPTQKITEVLIPCTQQSSLFSTPTKTQAKASKKCKWKSKVQAVIKRKYDELIADLNVFFEGQCCDDETEEIDPNSEGDDAMDNFFTPASFNNFQ